MKVHLAVAAALVGAGILAEGVSAQTPQAPPMQSILAGKKLTPPIKGQAEVEYTKPATKRAGPNVVTKILVKNVSAAPIARLKIIETWFDKGGATIPGGEGVINGLLQPGEVQAIEISTPFNDKMNANSWNFVHANGNVKPKLVKALDAPPAAGKEPAAKPATTTTKKK